MVGASREAGSIAHDIYSVNTELCLLRGSFLRETCLIKFSQAWFPGVLVWGRLESANEKPTGCCLEKRRKRFLVKMGKLRNSPATKSRLL